VEDMILAKDLYTSQGVFLLPKGSVLDEKSIKRIRSFHKLAPIIGGVKIERKINNMERSRGGRE